MADRFDKFTERARRVLTLAQEEAHRFNHNYIGTEHILLGLVREGDGVAAKGGIGGALNLRLAGGEQQAQRQQRHTTHHKTPLGEKTGATL